MQIQWLIFWKLLRRRSRKRQRRSPALRAIWKIFWPNSTAASRQWHRRTKRAKETKRQEKKTEVKQKDGTVKVIQKYKRKKRFGRSINRRAPARFLLELKRKAEAVGGVYAEVDTKEFKASQYNHVTDTYEKIPLSQREKEIGKRKVQRDLYSAFLIRNADLDFKHPDREKCEYEFEHFANLQDQLILKMKESGLSMRQCFGF